MLSIICVFKQQGCIDERLTVAGNPGECDIHLYRQFLPSTLVDGYGGINVDSSVVEKLNQ